MKKFMMIAATILLTLSMLAGCSQPQAQHPADTTAPATTAPATTAAEPTTEPAAPVETTEALPTDGDTVSDDPYAQRIGQYHTALTEQWDEGTCLEQELSHLTAFYYEGNALDNVGYTLMDLNEDGSQELVIGAILNAEQDPLVFEIWTMKDGEAVMLAQSGSRNRYYLQYSEEDVLWSVAYEAENGAANHAVYYLQLLDGEFVVNQGIVFDALANESEPWFMAYDLDWDVSNDMPIDEDTANAIMEAGRNDYTAQEYTSFSLYN